MPSARKSTKTPAKRARPATLPTDTLSLCTVCAKVRRLKQFVLEHGAKGHECGVCHRTDQIATHPEAYGALSSLVRALLRFYYDEWAYNHHWGGEMGPESLLCQKNRIIEHASVRGFSRSAEGSEGFLLGLFDPPYPGYHKGIALYAGNSPEYGRLPPLRALSTSVSPLYEHFAQRLTKENYFEVETEISEVFASLNAGLRLRLRAGEVLFRARMGVGKRYLRHTGGWTARTLFQPYMGPDIGAPPPTSATQGRLNRSGVSFLYLASDQATAAAELRPHPGHHLSLAAFRSVQAINIADFSAIDIARYSGSDKRLELFHLGYTIGREISLPVTPEERQKYAITQFIADILRRQGFDGIHFPSSLGGGSNYCIFVPNLFTIDPSYGKVVYVKGLRYTLQKSDFLIEPTDDDIAL